LDLGTWFFPKQTMMIQLKLPYKTFCSLLIIVSLTSCSDQKQITQSAKENVLAAPVLQTAHVGISIYEPATGKYWFNYQGDHYFVPASNTKLPTCYAAMKYLGDSLVGLRYEETGEGLNIQPTGDPTFLHPDFTHHPVYDFLKNTSAKNIEIVKAHWEDEAYGSGWAWNDWDESYMAERSEMPIYGNVARFRYNGKTYVATPKVFRPVQDTAVAYDAFVPLDSVNDKHTVKRVRSQNVFGVVESPQSNRSIEIPFIAGGVWGVAELLKDTLHREINSPFLYIPAPNKYNKVIHSQPTDSLLKPMMHRSDNFFAEQSLLMVSNERLGVMNDAKIIDTLLKTDFKDLPQKPRWVDGSGLSRYNLFTPQDFVAILNKMKNEFGMVRIKVILPTGGEGTISSYFKSDSGYIFAKTGTLSGVVALSGFLYTKKGKLLIFSTLVNNHNGSATDVRRAMEKFLERIRNKY